MLCVCCQSVLDTFYSCKMCQMERSMYQSILHIDLSEDLETFFEQRGPLASLKGN